MFESDVDTPGGVKELNEFLSDKSYINGYSASQTDTQIFKKLGTCPSDIFPHVCRWYRHIESFGKERENFPSNIYSKKDLNKNALNMSEHTGGNDLVPLKVRGVLLLKFKIFVDILSAIILHECFTFSYGKKKKIV